MVSSDKPITVFEYQKLDWKPEKKDVLRVERLNSRFTDEVLRIGIEKGVDTC